MLFVTELSYRYLYPIASDIFNELSNVEVTPQFFSAFFAVGGYRYPTQTNSCWVETEKQWTWRYGKGSYIV